MIVDDIVVTAQEGVTGQEILHIVTDEQESWTAAGKEIASIDIAIDGGELIITTTEKSPINRVRRITGYCAPIDSFNPAKRAELRDRVVHFGRRNNQNK